MKVAAVQHDICWEDAAATCAHVAPMVATAVERGAQLVLLAEMFATGFSMAIDRVAEGLEGPTTTFLVEQAAATGAWVGGSISVRRRPTDERATNTFTLAGPSGELVRYDKLHPFAYGGEDRAYVGGPADGITTVDVGGVRTTPFVCYDLRFANAFWDRAEATDLYVVVANWPEARREHWRVLLRARAIEDQAYVVGVNRVGHGRKLAYVGDSCIIDPLGQDLAVAGHDEEVLVADVDPATVASVRARFPFLADRRTLSR